MRRGSTGVAGVRAGNVHSAVRYGFRAGDVTFALRVLLGEQPRTFMFWEWWWLSVPMINAIVAWGTNVVAVEMIFKPVEFYPAALKLYHPKGQPFGLFGWQGIIPSKAERMAERLVDLMTNKDLGGFDIAEVFHRIDPKYLAAQLDGEARELATDLLWQMGHERFGKLWGLFPDSVLDQVVAFVAQDLENLITQIHKDLASSIESLVDIKSLVVQAAAANPDVVSNMFQVVGRKELSFIRLSGLYFGLLLGACFLALFPFVDMNSIYIYTWMLPLTGFASASLTNWIALKMIFSPIDPIYIFGRFRIQGLFLRRQKEASRVFASLFAETFLSREILREQVVVQNHALLRKTVEATCARWVQIESRQSSKTSSRLPILLYGSRAQIAQLIGEKNLAHLTQQLSDAVCKQIGFLTEADHPMRLLSYVDKTMQIPATIEHRLLSMPPKDFERLLHPIFEEDEWLLILVGGLLGVVVGAIQVGIQLALMH